MTFKFNEYCNLFEYFNIPASTQPLRTKFYPEGEFYNGVLIACKRDEEGNVCETFLDCSGKGCRTLESLNSDFDWFEFLNHYDAQIHDKTVHISRIDIACDLTDDEITMTQLFKYSYNEHYICKSKLLPDIRVKRTEEIYFGSPKSDRILRIYNKALEQGLPDLYWVRLEFQLRNKCATSFYLNWCLIKNVGELYSGIMIDFLRFVEVPLGKKVDDFKELNHRNRLPTSTWWSKLFGNVARVRQLYLPGDEYTILNLEQYLERQTYSSLRTYAIAHDGDITKLLDGINKKQLNNKQLQLLEQLKLNKITKSDLEKLN